MPLFGDLRSALRILARSPAYALTSTAVLALGIGVNVAIFSVVHSVVLAPLPYPDASRLVFVWQRLPMLPDPPFGRLQASRNTYREWKRQNTVFSDMAAFRAKDLDDAGTGHPQHVSTGFASANLFPMLGVQAKVGRAFLQRDEDQKDNRVAVLTDAFFERRFHRDPGILGKTLILSGDVYSVIGILPAQFHLPATSHGQDQLKPDLWVPLSRLWATPETDRERQLFVVARIKPGVPLAQARTEMAGIAKRLEAADPKQYKSWTATVFPFAVEDAAPTLHRALYVLLATVGFLLLIACANLANLALARAAQRSREIAVRLALGASRMRIIRQLLAESFLISLAGALAGLLLGHWCIQLILALKPPDIQRPESIGLNPAVFAFAAGLSVLCTLLFGLAPAVSVSRTDLNTTLKSAGGWGGSAARLRSRQFLIAAEVALALMLLAGAGLMIRSFRELVATGIGFRTQHLITATVDLPAHDFPDGASQSRFFHALMDRARAIPGVTESAVVDMLPLQSVRASNFFIAGRPDPPQDARPIADNANVSPNYFRVIGLRLLAGRFFTDADLAQAEQEHDSFAIINESMARQFFASVNPLGQRLLDSKKTHSYEIVGVVADYRPMGAENPVRPQIFWPYLKQANATLIARTSGDPTRLATNIQEAIWSLDRGIAETKVQTLDFILGEWQSQRKFNTLLLVVFAGMALLLAMIGIYGVLSNLVTSRVREIGIRMAIGAAPAEIARLILTQSMLPISIGLAIGLAGTLALGRFVEALLFHVRPRDPLTLALAVAAILLVSPLALFVPLRRATSVDCTVALREE
jgi:putative ABC transport system permease protein